VSLLKYLFKIGLFKILFPQLPLLHCFISVIQHALCKLEVSVNSQRHFPTHDMLRPSLNFHFLFLGYALPLSMDLKGSTATPQQHFDNTGDTTMVDMTVMMATGT
jgi:hypothetical protein